MSSKVIDLASRRRTIAPRALSLLEQIDHWLDHLRAHGIADEEVTAALESDQRSFLALLRDDLDYLARLQRLRPGASVWQIVREVQELAADHGLDCP